MPIRLATKRFFLVCFLGSLILDVAAGIVAAAGWSRSFVDELGATVVLTSACSLAAFGAAIPLERRHWPITSLVGMTLILCTFGQVVPLIWIDGLARVEVFAKVAALTAVFGGLLTHLSLISIRKPGQPLAWIRRLAMVIACLLGAVITGYILAEPSYPTSVGWELAIWMLVLIGACSTVAVPVVQVLRKNEAAESIETVRPQMILICPRCDMRQSVQTGESRCVSCKLRFKIEIEEPRCEQCGYLLYQLMENRCPECGAVFDKS